MVIIGSNSFPPENANEVGKRFLKFPPLPDYMTMKGTYVHGLMGGELQEVEFLERDKAKLAEGIEYVINRYAPYFRCLALGLLLLQTYGSGGVEKKIASRDKTAIYH
ncbi:MAG: hypothetical protein OEM06_09060 [Desulfobacteraceae bacterium]|nr:hypothetical protein [Desulfobacteraceae bacterium]